MESEDNPLEMIRKFIGDPFEILWKSFENPIDIIWKFFGNHSVIYFKSEWNRNELLRKAFGNDLETHWKSIGFHTHSSPYRSNPAHVKKYKQLLMVFHICRLRVDWSFNIE